jgi:hypothetical protein
MAQISFGTSPVTGSDQTVGLTADSMDVDPTTGQPYYDEEQAALAAAQAAQAAAAQPQGPSMTTVLLVVGGAGLAWYGWKHHWFDKWMAMAKG